MNSNHKTPIARIRTITGLILTAILAGPSLGHAEQVTHSYDDLNRLIKSDYGSGNVIDYAYDAAGNRRSQKVTTATVPNQPPIANAGSDQTVRLGSLVTLDGSASTDPDNGPSPLIFTWLQTAGTSFSLTNPATATPSFTPTKIGGYTFDLVVNDGEASSAADSVTISVGYNYTGFFSPVDNLPIQNKAKAGSAVPVKFSLAGNQGLGIFATGYPKSQSISCSSTAPSDAVEETVTAGNSSLSYDVANDRYTYVWKTTKSWKGSCRQLIVKLNDGSEHKANFIFK